MRKLLLLFLSPLAVFGQSHIKTNQVDTTSTGFQTVSNVAPRVKAQSFGIFDSGISPILTGLNTSNIKAAFATNQIFPSATKAFDLRRSSDNVVQTFYFDATGRIPIDLLNKFISGYRGYVTKWYDQSGNGNDATQSNTALQPYVVIEKHIIKVRFEEMHNGTAGHALDYTLGTGINVNNTTIFCAYSNYLANGNDQVNVTPNFTSRYLLSTANHKLDLFIDGTDGTKPNAFKMNTTSTSTLYGWGHNNYWAINSSGSATKVWSNYGNISQSAQSSFTETQWEIGNKIGTDATPFSGDLYFYVQYNTSQTDATIDTLAARGKVQYQLVSPSDGNTSVVYVGDSETAGRGATNNQNAASQVYYNTKIPFINFGITGNTFALQNASNFNTAVYGCILSGVSYLNLWMGTNDVSNGRTQAQAYADNVSYAQAAHTAGFTKVAVLTALDRGSVNTLPILNADLIGNTTDFDATLPVAEDSRLLFLAGFGGSTTTLSFPDYGYFNRDNVHLIAQGNAVVASYIQDYINSLLPTTTIVDNLLYRIKKLESTISGLINTAILNQPSNQPGSLGVDSIHTTYINGGMKPLQNINIDANSSENTANLGNIFINRFGGAHVNFGPVANMVTDASVTYSPGSNPAFGIYKVAFNDPSSVGVRWEYFGDGTQNTATNTYMQFQNTSPYFLTKSYYDIQTSSTLGTIWWSTAGLDGLGQSPQLVNGAYTPLVGTYGYTKTATSFLNLSVGQTYAKTSPLKFMPGVTQQTTPEQGAVNFDGTDLYLARGSSPVNYKFAFQNSGVSATIAGLGQTTLVAGTKAITITGLTTSSKAFVTLVTASGTSLTTQYQAVCSSNTVTIQANVAAGTINVSDTSTLNYQVYQ